MNSVESLSELEIDSVVGGVAPGPNGEGCTEPRDDNDDTSGGFPSDSNVIVVMM